MKFKIVYWVMFWFFVSPFAKADNGLTIYVYPPNFPIDWSTPKTTLNSFIRNTKSSVFAGTSYSIRGVDDHGKRYSLRSNYESTMGHTIVHANCQLPDRSRYNKWSSYSGMNSLKDSKNISIRTQLGFGALFHNFDDGHLITGNENIHRLIYVNGRRVLSGDKNQVVTEKPYFIHIPNIRQSQCARVRHMVRFFEYYNRFKVNVDAGYKLFFSNNFDPYDSYRAFFENGQRGQAGGGCAPYGVAFLKLLGLWSDRLESLTAIDIAVGDHLIGDGVNKKIGINDIRQGPLGRVWVRAGEKIKKFFQYDPYKIWHLIGRIRACRGAQDYHSMTCTEAAKGLLDQRLVSGRLPRARVFRDSQEVKQQGESEVFEKTVEIRGVILNN